MIIHQFVLKTGFCTNQGISLEDYRSGLCVVWHDKSAVAAAAGAIMASISWPELVKFILNQGVVFC